MQFNKSSVVILLIALAVGCNKQPSTEEPNTSINLTEVHKSETTLSAVKGLVYFKNQPFTGITVERFPNDSLAEKVSYLDGKKHGQKEKWYKSGQVSYRATYHKGKLTDTSYTYWKDGQLRSKSHYNNGVLHGNQKQWYRSGQLFKEMNYANGVESGMQKAWRENGKIYNNYEAKDGKIYGLKRSTLCYELEDETVQFAD